MSIPRTFSARLARTVAPEVPLRNAVPTRTAPDAVRVLSRWTPLLVFLAASGIAWLRTSPTAGSIVYAEDGRVFLGDQEMRGFLPSLFAPYTGYLQLLPRLIVGAVRSALPLEAYPLAIAVSCAAVVGAVAALVFVWSAAVSDRLSLRVTMAAITVLAPVAPIEVAGNAANIHWYALWGAFWLLLHRPSTRGEAIALAPVAVVFALTEIQTVLLLPLMLLRARSSRDWIVRAGLLAALALQFAGLIHAPRTVISAHPPLLSIAAGWLLSVPTSVYAVPDATHGTLLTTIGPVAGAAALVPALTALLYVLVRGTGTVRAAAVGLAALSLLVWLAAVWANTVDTGIAGFDVLHSSPEEFVTVWYSRFAQVPSRYSLVPSMCIAALPVLATAVWEGRRRTEAAPRVFRAILVPVLTVLVLSLNFVPTWSTRDGNPNWIAEVAAARQQCAQQSAQADLRTAPAGWSVTVPCAALR